MEFETQLGHTEHFPAAYISVVDQVVPREFCLKLIEKFEANEDSVQVNTDLENVRHFKEVNISQHWHDEHEMFVTMVQNAWKHYKTENGIEYNIQWPTQFGYEHFRMKRYLPNGKDEFGIHTDVGSYGSARRFLAFMWYLNTVEEGGQTQFGYKHTEPRCSVPAMQGRLLMFPPLWTHPHWGCKPLSGPKYIVTGYLHYI